MHDECDSNHLFSVQAFYEQYSERLDKFDHIHMVFGGLQLVAIGLIGEYIGKVYLETKSRPKFIIEKY